MNQLLTIIIALGVVVLFLVAMVIQRDRTISYFQGYTNECERVINRLKKELDHYRSQVGGGCKL